MLCYVMVWYGMACYVMSCHVMLCYGMYVMYIYIYIIYTIYTFQLVPMNCYGAADRIRSARPSSPKHVPAIPVAGHLGRAVILNGLPCSMMHGQMLQLSPC